MKYNLTFNFNQSKRIGHLADVKVRVVSQIVVHGRPVPGGTVVRVIAVMEVELLPRLQVPGRHSAGDHPVYRVGEEPFSAVVVEAVVHLVAEGGAVVVQVYQLPRQVHPLPACVVSVDEDLVARAVPVLLFPRYVGQPHPIIECHHLALGDPPHCEEALPAPRH